MSRRSSRSCPSTTLLALTTALIGAGSTLALSHRAQTSAPLRARNIGDVVEEEYDFVIVGGGLSGLVLGARLTEMSNHKVLVLEAGGTGDADIRERIDTPGDAYYRSLLGTDFNWDFFTEPQERMNGKRVAWPRGRGVGGTTAINGLYMIRPGQSEVDDWRDLLGDMDGADKWGWDGLFAAMKKSETFDPPSAELAQRIGLAWNPASHGTSGPIHRGYPGYIFDQVKQWTDAVAATGAAHSDDTYGGVNWGTCVSMSSINAANWTRSWARAGYLDPLPPRSLYHVVPNAQVGRIIWDDASPADNKKAVGVEYSRDGGRTTSRVTAKTEVILAAGVIGSPTILMHSGVGPRDVLEAAGVPVTISLPGVGQHLQDHMAAAITFTTDQPTAESVRSAGGPEASDPAFLSYINSATSYINLTAIFAGGEENAVQGFADYHASEYANVSVTVPSRDPTVLAGNKALYDLAVEHFRGPVPVVELLLALNSAGVLRITAALQQPLSFGRLYINTTDAFAYPLIDANYFASSADLTIMRDSLRFARRVGQTAPLNTTLTGEASPGLGVETDEQWDAWIRGEAGSQYHPSSTCAMMPRNLGGVVDAKLKVYGTSNVRVIDGSVPPKSLSAHWMEICYGVAEQGSEIVLAQHGVGAARPGGTVGATDGDAGVSARPAVVGVAVALFTTVLAFVF